MKFKEWFETKLTVGSYPYINNSRFESKEFDYCINVSDEFYVNIDASINELGCKTHWFPMNECKKDNGLNSIYGAMVILLHAERNNKRVYLHCHAGIHRSQLVKCAYYYMRTGQHLDNKFGSFINQLIADCTRGYLPPKNETESFLSYLGEKLKNETFNVNTDSKILIVSSFGGTLDDCKINSIRNF